MKLFSLEEANQLIAVVRPILKEIASKNSEMRNYAPELKAVGKAAQLGGSGMKGGSVYVNLLIEISELTRELQRLGIQLKDYSRGLIDFPCEKDGRIVLLCWQLGEADEIEWWHDIDAGFAGRRRL